MNEPLHDITSPEDIRLLVDAFYFKVKQDALLEPVFSKVLGTHWDHHMPVMYRFWGTLLLGEMSYQGNPFLKHVEMPLTPELFERWLALFLPTVDELFQGPVAEDAKNRARSIAHVFQVRMGLTPVHIGKA